MKLFITGGAYQGKTDYAKNMDAFKDAYVADFEASDVKILLDECNDKEKIIYKNCHRLIWWAETENIGIDSIFGRLTDGKNDWCIIMNEIGSGIVPIDRAERVYRENAGRFGCLVAENADMVVRAVCGIGMVIKG